MSRSSWTQEDVDKLIKLATENLKSDKKLSATDMGKILGKSKNAIVGKIHRLGLARIAQHSSQQREGEETSPNGKRKTDSPLESATQEGLYELHQIDDTMCVWPCGGDEPVERDEDGVTITPNPEDAAAAPLKITFCGRKVVPRSGKFYCEEHFKKAYLRFSQKEVNTK